jgi:diadenosine tetraphosphate (Ap4A) HIT family hydrolase
MTKQILYEDEIGRAFFPENAAAKGHIIVEPIKKIDSIENISEAELEHLFYLANYTATVLFETLGAQGTNIITEEENGFKINIIARKQDDGLDFQWEPKQLSQGDLESVTSSISGKMVIGQREEFKQTPVIEDQPEDRSMNDDEENYLLKQLDRIP